MRSRKNNLEVYLRRFLGEALLPLDNNDAERSIKSVYVEKHSWHIIDSTKGAKASALLYSIAENAKANSLKPYEYFCCLLTELMKYPRNNVPAEVLKTLMPWSKELPNHCRKNEIKVTLNAILLAVISFLRANFNWLRCKFGAICQAIFNKKLVDYSVKYRDDLVLKFEEDDEFRIAVSVDMLDTGLDVPAVLKLMFFKKVRSKSKFVQMIGHGTRDGARIFTVPAKAKADSRFLTIAEALSIFASTRMARALRKC